MHDDASPNRLGAYLRARRDLVSPEQAGIPGGAHRRVPGLRREEVALLAGISGDYYLRLERGKYLNPSAQVLSSLARVLQLDDVEQQYLFDLAEPKPAKRARRRPERVPARLHDLLATVAVPAFVEGRSFDVLASNALAVALSPRLRPGENRLRSMLLDPEERSFHVDWEADTAQFVALFRSSIGTASDDARTVELVGELSLASARFRELWARHDVRQVIGGTTRVNHPQLGALELHRDKLQVGDVTLVLYYPDVTSDDADTFRMLAALAESPSAGRLAAAGTTDDD